MRPTAILIALLCTWCLALAVDPDSYFANYPEVRASQHPVVFRPTSHVIASGTNRLRLFINLTSPCETFNDYLFDVTDDTAKNDMQEEAFKEICEKEYEQSIVSVLASNCQLVDENSALASIKSSDFVLDAPRRKRAIGEYVKIAKNVANFVSWLVSFGFSVHQAYARSTLNSKFNKMAAEFESHVREEQRLHQINAEVLTELRAAIAASEANLREQVNTSLESVIDAVHFSRLLASTQSRLSSIGLRLALFFKDFKLGKVDRDQFNFLFPDSGIDQSCAGCDSIEHWKARSCKRFSNSSLLLTIETAVVDSAKKVLKIDPFEIRADIDEGDSAMQCLYHYTGPRFLIYDTVRNCSIFREFEPSRDHDTTFLIDGVFDAICSHNLTDKLSLSLGTAGNYWKRDLCWSSDSQSPFLTLQIKSSIDHNYFYCNGLRLRVGYNIVDCNNEILLVSRNIPVQFVDPVSGQSGAFSAMIEESDSIAALDMLRSSDIDRINEIAPFPKLLATGQPVDQFSKVDALLDQYTTSTQSIVVTNPQSLLRYVSNSKNTWTFAIFITLFTALSLGVIVLAVTLARKFSWQAIMQLLQRLPIPGRKQKNTGWKGYTKKEIQKINKNLNDMDEFMPKKV